MNNSAAEDGEEEEEFYESLDRILSSSCSSTSCSDDDAAADSHRRRRRLPPTSSASTNSYDVWISEPSSVEERRRRLLQQMGLISDPALSRAGSGSGSGSDSRPEPEPEPVEIAAEPEPEEILRCTIRNLDNGEEFVVKEGGILDRVREVGTGSSAGTTTVTRRQLTVEEFEMCVGRSPIVQELMRRQNVENYSSSAGGDGVPRSGGRVGGSGPRWKKKGGWIRSIKNIAGNVVAGGYYRDQRRSSDERDSSSEKGGRRSSSATDDSQDGAGAGGGPLGQGPERIRVRHYGKPFKEITGLYLTQEIHAHTGSIWSIKFSLDGKYLASAGEDCVIHVWQVSEREKKGDLVVEGGGGENGTSPESALALACIEGSHWEKKRRAKVSNSRKSVSSDHVLVPDQLFALAENPVCSFWGHLDDVLDLSWSKSQYLLSSSMDKTVRLWHMSSNSCLKVFSHSDYVTCIQFNPVDHDFFISGSLDEKVRIWSIPDRQVVDWNDLHEMVTAASYTPDGKGALVGSHKGSCHLYDTSDNKLHQKSQINLQNKKKKSSRKKITGFQFAPGSSSEVLITSADSRIRVVDGTELVHKFKGFRNNSSQISASLASNGKYVVCASEDSHVYVWRCDTDSQPTRNRGIVSVTQAYEHFYSQHVTVAVPWPCNSPGVSLRTNSSSRQNGPSGVSEANQELVDEANGHEKLPTSSFRCSDCPQQNGILGTRSNSFGDRVTATWPEEKLLLSSNQSTPRSSVDMSNGRMQLHSRSAWGMVIVTAGRGGRIRTFQNFGFPA
ncbi:WD repeat-containing protein 44-like [Iris pallida]|uniref:WD repeat-containing protein 44-like n=1 Tax=Iris pallida TaxID=29817 RepID=A0AAX6HBA4_IRIPA|nr:WD repeat-containing protein 44-like [Iris pallida]